MVRFFQVASKDGEVTAHSNKTALVESEVSYIGLSYQAISPTETIQFKRDKLAQSVILMCSIKENQNTSRSLRYAIGIGNTIPAGVA
jgi:hypothetical protein